MAETKYFIPGEGFYTDTEQGEPVFVPGVGFVTEQEGGEPPASILPTMMNQNGNLQTLSGGLL